MPNQALEQTRGNVLGYGEGVGCERLNFFVRLSGLNSTQSHLASVTSAMPQLDRSALSSIALYQRGIILGIIVYLLAVVGQFAIPEAARPLLGIAIIPFLLATLVFLFLLACKLYGVAKGVLLGILGLIPLVGLVVLLIVNGKATQVLRAHGLKVGFLGASIPKS